MKSPARIFARYEFKFPIIGADVEKIRSVLAVNAKPVRLGEGEYSQVHSVYFDDAALSSCRESLAGVSVRQKVRMRWYDRDLPGQQVFFEVKARRSNTVNKRRLTSDSTRVWGTATYPEILSEFAGVLGDEDAAILSRFDVATVIVSYRRQHFVDPESPIRLTLDWGIEAYDQIGHARLVRRFGRRLEGLVVIEAKVPLDTDCGRVRELIHPLKLRLARCSKYVASCQVFDLGQLRDAV